MSTIGGPRENEPMARAEEGGEHRGDTLSFKTQFEWRFLIILNLDFSFGFFSLVHVDCVHEFFNLQHSGTQFFLWLRDDRGECPLGPVGATSFSHRKWV
jgi:hypothetical protein